MEFIYCSYIIFNVSYSFKTNRSFFNHPESEDPHTWSANSYICFGNNVLLPKNQKRKMTLEIKPVTYLDRHVPMYL